MIKGRQALADALARLLFEKPLAQLDRSERAELNFLRALDAKAPEALLGRGPHLQPPYQTGPKSSA